MLTGRAMPLASLGALALGTVLMLSLHVLPPTDEIDPVRRTISQYALGPNKWLFDIAVLLVAAGSALAFGELVRRRLVRALSAPVVFGALWTVSLLVIVWYTKNDWTVGPSVGGQIHRYASVVAYLALPVAILLAARRVFPDAPAWRRTAQTFGLLALSGLGVLLVGVLRMLSGGGPWWRFVPLGLVERLMAASAVAAVAVLVLGVLVRAKSGDAVAVPA